MTEPSHDEPGESGAAAPAPRWWQRAVVVGGAAVIALTVAVTAVPGLADEVEVSTTRSAQPFVELFLTAPPKRACTQGTVRFRVRSHLEEPTALRYVVAVITKSDRVRWPGEMNIEPDGERSARVRIPARIGDRYDVTVRLQGRPEMLRVHCGGGAS